MGYITSELINLFNFLLPGFITSLIFASFTSFPKKSEFELVIMALIYTVIINSVVEILGMAFIAVGKTSFSIAEWTSTVKVLWSVFLALLLGFLLAYLYNNDLLHKLMRKLKITNQTSYPTEWYGAFSETKSYIVLHFDDGRRIMGWPLEWPTSPKKGHFILENATWLNETEDNENKNEEIRLSNVKKIMLDATGINMVEFLKPLEVKNES
jgi:phosphate/sulfate permease